MCLEVIVAFVISLSRGYLRSNLLTSPHVMCRSPLQLQCTRKRAPFKFCYICQVTELDLFGKR
jgi:hypothetical protein